MEVSRSVRLDSRNPNKTGVYKVPYNLKFFLNPNFFNLYFLYQNFRHLLFSPHDILPNSLNIIGKMILLPLYFFPMFILPHSHESWYSLPSSQLDILPQQTWLTPPPPRATGEGDAELYTPLENKWKRDQKNSQFAVQSRTDELSNKNHIWLANK